MIFCYSVVTSTCRPALCELKQEPFHCMVPGGARSKIGRWMQELGRLQAMRKPGSLTTSGLIISELIKVGCYSAGPISYKTIELVLSLALGSR